MGSVYAGPPPKASQLNIDVCRYTQTDTTSTVSSGGGTNVLDFSTADLTTDYVTYSGTSDTTFTINKTGIWIIEFSTRLTFGAATTTGDMFVYADLNGGVQIVGETIPAPMSTARPGSTTIRILEANDVIRIIANNGTDQTATFSTNAEDCHVSLTWLQGKDDGS